MDAETPIERVTEVPLLPPRSESAHKGEFGRVVVLAGSRGMAGAAALSGASALKAGGRLVRVLCPIEVQPTVASFDACLMTWPLPMTDLGQVAFPATRPAIERFLADADALAIGPGLGGSEDIRELVRWAVESVEVPTVIDADALNALVGRVELLKTIRRPVVLTPHPGEFARLTNVRIAEVQADREGRAVALARLAEPLVVVLKGAGSVVTDGRRVFVNDTGNPGMATGGTGDVLTGVIAALLAQRATPFDAAALGVHAHGLAGDVARDQSGEIGMTAGDLLDALPDAFVHLHAH